MEKYIPPKVKKAIKNRNYAALSHMGKEGQKKSQAIRLERRQLRELAFQNQQERKKNAIADAHSHVENNRAAWDDEYDPADEEVIFLNS